MKFTGLPDVEMVLSTKRAAPGGTPDRETETRAKKVVHRGVSKGIEYRDGEERCNSNQQGGVQRSHHECFTNHGEKKQTMMREEVNRGIADMEAKLMTKMEDLQYDLAEKNRLESCCHKRCRKEISNINNWRVNINQGQAWTPRHKMHLL